MTIDTSLGRASVRDLGTNSTAALYGLTFAPQGLDIVNNTGRVVLDQVQASDSVGGDGLLVSGSARVKLQDSSFSGANSIQIIDSTVFLAKGGQTGPVSLDSTSTLTHVESALTPGDFNTSPGASVDGLVGSSPRLEVPRVLSLGAVVPLTVTGTPNEVWIAYLADARGWLDLTTIGLPFDMVLLLDPGPAFRSYSVGQIPPSGFQTVVAGRPTDPALTGLTFPVQILSADLGTLTFRLGNLREVVFLP